MPTKVDRKRKSEEDTEEEREAGYQAETLRVTKKEG